MAHENKAYEGIELTPNGGPKAIQSSSKPPRRSSSKRVAPEIEKEPETIVLYGSGDMTMGLITRFLLRNVHPVVASRYPERSRKRLKERMNVDVDVRNIEEGLKASEVIIVAIPSEHHESLTKYDLKEKIVVDISNRSFSDSSKGLSNAENLQELLPESHVVKAFNTISAYSLYTQGVVSGSQEVPICGDSKWARERVSTLVRDIGFTPMDKGSLRNSRQAEGIPIHFFPEWKSTFILTTSLLVFYGLVLLFTEQLCPNIDRFREEVNSTKEWDFSSFNLIPLLNFQFTLACTATTILLATYMPGTIAAYIQLFRGTKYSRFPKWLVNWMKCRKQLGLMALLLGSTHGCAAIFTMMSWKMGYDWHEQMNMMMAALLMASFGIVGITSLPSVASSLTWREFTLIQRFGGWTCLILAGLHGAFSNWDRLLNEPQCVVIPSGGQIVVTLSIITVAVKLPLMLPCVDWYLTRIRNGYERPRKVSPA